LKTSFSKSQTATALCRIGQLNGQYLSIKRKE